MGDLPYVTYKHSGSDWLGEIPSHWEVKKLKFLATVQPSNVDKKSIEGEENVMLCNYTDVYKNEYIDSSLVFMRASATASEIKKFTIDKDDVIVTKDSEDPRDIAVPACASEKVEGLLCGYHLTQIKSLGVYGRYVFRLFQSSGFNAQFIVAANGVTRFGLPQYAISNSIIPKPPLTEQQTIAAFLDYKTAKIDALIAKKKALLEKLAEKRSALISHTVTKGLDPNAPMRDSGIDWLGEIPAHWDFISIRWLIRIGSGDYIANTETEFDCSENASVPVIGGNGIMAYTNNFNTAENCIVIGRVGAHCGNIHFIQEKSWVTDNALRVNIISGQLDTLFFVSVLKALRLNDFANKNAQPLITGEMVKSKKIPIPPLEEQRQIHSYIEALENNIEKQTSVICRAITRLQEYRSALITNAVTGKIDVRNFRLPETEERVNHG